MTQPRIDLRPGITEPVVIVFSRQLVESCDPSEPVSTLVKLFNSAEMIWRYRGQVTLVFNGYDDDSRALVEIPEVRAFLARFDQQWPYWAFFLNQVDNSICILMSCLCGSKFPGGGQVEIDAQKLRRFMGRGFAAMNAIFDDHGFPESELEAITNGIVEVLEQIGVI